VQRVKVLTERIRQALPDQTPVEGLEELVGVAVAPALRVIPVREVREELVPTEPLCQPLQAAVPVQAVPKQLGRVVISLIVMVAIATAILEQQAVLEATAIAGRQTTPARPQYQPMPSSFLPTVRMAVTGLLVVEEVVAEEAQRELAPASAARAVTVLKVGKVAVEVAEAAEVLVEVVRSLYIVSTPQEASVIVT